MLHCDKEKLCKLGEGHIGKISSNCSLKSVYLIVCILSSIKLGKLKLCKTRQSLIMYLAVYTLFNLKVVNSQEI